MHIQRSLAIVASAVALASCHQSSAPAVTGQNGFTLLVSDCDPLVPTKCGFPFPSDVWRVQDPATQQFHLHFGDTTLPDLAGTTPTDPTLWDDKDGFSPAQALLAQLPGATSAGLPDENHLALSVTTSSPTIVMNADTGAFIPHIAELDAWAPSADEQSFIIRPLQRLDDGQRYIVAIRHVVDASGNPVAASPAFAALRDQASSTDGSVALRRTLYEDIFSKLAAQGIARSDLQLAWDFTTATSANTQTDLLTMRDRALAAVGADGPSYVITQIEQNPNQYIAQRIHGTMTVPFFLSSTDDETGVIVRDQGGLPVQNGTQTFPFLVHVPNSCTGAGVVCPVVQNGHGLLGDESEGEDSYLAQFAGQFHYVALAVDWWGFDASDLGAVVNAVADDVGGFKILVEHQEQGMVNNLLAMRMMKGRFASEPAVQVNGAPLYDPTQLFYRGDSQGGIFGSTYMSISTDVTRGLLGEPGMPYNLLLDRSHDFEGYRNLLKGALPDARDEELYLDLIQEFWDRVEPTGFTPLLAAGNATTPAHRVLIHTAIGDHQVPTLGAHVLARELAAQNLTPVNREVFAVADNPGPITTGSAMVEFSFGLAAVPTENLPPDCTIPAVACANPDQYDTDPHELVRTEPDAMEMADVFFRTGTIAATCDGGPCDPE